MSVTLQAQFIGNPNYVTYIINNHTNQGSPSSFIPLNPVDTTFNERWIEFDFGTTAKIINEYYVTGEYDFHLLEAKNSDQTDWTILTEVDTAHGNFFSFTNSTEYQYYRFRLTDNNTSGTDKIETIYLSTSSSILPVEYSYINASHQDQNVLIEWHTLTELNNSHFVIEKSDDAISFEKVAIITAYNSDFSTYNFLDNGSTAKYYRVKQIDIDGTHSYSEIIEVKKIVQSLITISRDKIDINFQNLTGGNMSIFIVNATGEICFSQNIELSKNNTVGNSSIDLSHYSTGYYILKVVGNQTKQTEKFFLN